MNNKPIELIHASCFHCKEEKYCVPFEFCKTSQIFYNPDHLVNNDFICKRCHMKLSHVSYDKDCPIDLLPTIQKINV